LPGILPAMSETEALEVASDTSPGRGWPPPPTSAAAEAE
jgi:hypothetical protein